MLLKKLWGYSYLKDTRNNPNITAPIPFRILTQIWPSPCFWIVFQCFQLIFHTSVTVTGSPSSSFSFFSLVCSMFRTIGILKKFDNTPLDTLVDWQQDYVKGTLLIRNKTRMEFYGVKLVWELRWDWDVIWSFSLW